MSQQHNKTLVVIMVWLSLLTLWAGVTFHKISEKLPVDSDLMYTYRYGKLYDKWDLFLPVYIKSKDLEQLKYEKRNNLFEQRYKEAKRKIQEKTKNAITLDSSNDYNWDVVHQIWEEGRPS